MATKQLLMYIPVIHRGYEDFVRRHKDADEILVLGRSFHDWFPHLAKDIRALDPASAARDLRLRVPAVNVRVIETGDLNRSLTANVLVMPDEDIMRDIRDFRLSAPIGRVELESTWLRYDRRSTIAVEQVRADEDCDTDTLGRLLPLAQAEQSRSSDWWRRVAVVIEFTSGIVLSSYNRHLPTEYSPYVDGDPRSNFSRGESVELSTAIHAEASLIGRCARTGMGLDGAKMLVTTFPCPPCAKLIAAAGIIELLFVDGYAVMDGEQVLRQAGVKLVRINK